MSATKRIASVAKEETALVLVWLCSHLQLAIAPEFLTRGLVGAKSILKS